MKLEVPPGQRQQVDALLKAIGAQNVLLIMDGFERALRLYANMNAAYQSDEEKKIEDAQRDCVNINAEIFLKNLCVLPNIKSKVLMTTRLIPRIVEKRGELLGGCHEEKLQAMQKEDAVAFFRAQGIRGARAEIEAACEPYGYHPLCLRILAGLIANDRESPGNIAVAEKLDITEDVIQNKHHVLEAAYNTLHPEQQKLLSCIACFRSAMTYEALKAISDNDIDANLKTLELRGLLHWNKPTNRYDLHPIVRRYAYERLTTHDRIVAHTRLRDYFAAVNIPKKVRTLVDLSPTIELYHHTVQAGQLDEAIKLFYDRIIKSTYYQFGAYQMQIELLRTLFFDSEEKLLRLEKVSWQGFVLNALANAYSLSGQPHRAVRLFEIQITIQEKQGNKKRLATGLGNMAISQLRIGALGDAKRNLLRRIDLGREIGNEYSKANGHHDLSHVLSYCGKWEEAEQEHDRALNIVQKLSATQAEGTIWAHHAQHFLMMARNDKYSTESHYQSAVECARHALELADEAASIRYPVERDYVCAYWLLGASYRASGNLLQAEIHLNESLTRCRAINLVEMEANILLDLAHLRYDQENLEEAKSLAEEALLITERSGYVLQGADVHLFLAQYALEQEKDQAKAKELAEKAKELAYCDGPPYTYKVAYEEAEHLLENLK